MANDTLQAITAALSSAGLTAYLKHFVNSTYAAHLNGQAAPNDTFASNSSLSAWGVLTDYKADLRNGCDLGRDGDVQQRDVPGRRQLHGRPDRGCERHVLKLARDRRRPDLPGRTAHVSPSTTG